MREKRVGSSRRAVEVDMVRLTAEVEGVISCAVVGCLELRRAKIT